MVAADGRGYLESVRGWAPTMPLIRVVVAADLVAAIALSAGAFADVRLLDTDRAAVQWVAAALALTCTVSVSGRRFAPVWAALVALGSATAYQVLTHDPRFTFEPYAVLLVLYLLGRTELDGHRLRHRVVLAAAAPAFATIAVASGGGPALAVGSFAIFVLGPYAAGALVTRHARDAAELRARIDVLLGERELRARTAAADERLRIARELHDVAAHCLTEMVVQAGAARIVRGRDPTAAKAALTTVTGSGRAAVAELTRLVEDTHDESGPDGSRLLDLVAATSRGPVSVAVAWLDGRRPIPGPTDLVGHRVVREALTNAARHAPGAPAFVAIRVRSDVLDIAVANGAASPARRALPGAGLGLVGIRERVAALGGSVDSGPTPDGGYAVHVRLPMTPVDQSPTAARSDRGRRFVGLGTATPILWLVLLIGEALTSSHRTGPVTLNILAVAGMAVASTLRRRAPVAFLAIVGLLAIALSAGLTSRDYATLTGFYTVVVPAYAVGSGASRQRAVVALGAYAIVATAVGAALHAPLSGLVGPLLAEAAAGGAGMLAGSQRALRHGLDDAERAVLEQTSRLEELAVRRERISVAERHHAVVLGQVREMLVLAESATRLLRTGADPAPALASIEEQGREALTRMRDILGALRAMPTDVRVRPGGPDAPVERRPRGTVVGA
jgi:signal transduction histidine kinase